MKLNKLIPLAVFAISVTSIAGCSQKIKRKTFAEIFEEANDTKENSYYFETEYGNNYYLMDVDGYMLNEIKKLDVKKRFLEPEKGEHNFTYQIYRHDEKKYSVSRIEFYENGSIIVNDYGSHILDSYNYFSISKEEMTTFFKVCEDRVDYSDKVLADDYLATKTEKTMDAFVQSLQGKNEIPCYLHVGYRNTFKDNGDILDMIANTEFTYEETSTSFNFDSEKIGFVYNAEDFGEVEENQWYFVMARYYTDIFLVNYMRYDQAGHEYRFYVNEYSVSKEAGYAIYQAVVDKANSHKQKVFIQINA